MSDATGQLSEYTGISPAELILIPVATAVLLFYIFTQRRKRLKLDVLQGRPGVVYPINFLNPRHRMVYVLALSALAAQWLKLLFLFLVGANGIKINQWGSVVVNPIFVMIYVSLLVLYTYPILASVEAPIPITGYIIGTLYCHLYLLVVFIVWILQLRDVKDLGSLPTIGPTFASFFGVYYSVQQVPQMLCLCGVIAWYYYKLYHEVKRLSKVKGRWETAILEQPKSLVHSEYVKYLLKRHGTTATGAWPKIKKWWNYVIYRLPLSMLITIAISTMFILQLVLIAGSLFGLIFQMFAGDTVITHNPIFIAGTALVVVATVASAIVTLGILCYQVYILRKNLLELRTHTSKLAKEIHLTDLESPPATLSAAVKYAGYQIAASVIGWILITILLILFGALLGLFKVAPERVGFYVYKIVVTLIWGIIIIQVQKYVCWFIFLSKESFTYKTLVLTNRRLFNWFVYYVLLYNIGTGILANITRIAKGLALSLLFIPRLDRLIFVKGFEKYDNGYATYRGFLVYEALLHNPIVHVFVDILSEKTPATTPTTIATTPTHDTTYQSETASLLSSGGSGSGVDYGSGIVGFGSGDVANTGQRPRLSQRAYNRWMLAYTLLNHPDLINYRRRGDSSSLLQSYQSGSYYDSKDSDDEEIKVSCEVPANDN